MSTPVPAWTAPRRISHAEPVVAPISAEIEEARQRALHMSRRLTHGNRKSTLGLELKKLELEQIQSQIEDLTDSMCMTAQSKRHSRMIKEKMERDINAPTAPLPNTAAEGRRTVMRSIKFSKGWGDESPEWKAMMAKEQEMEAKEEAERIAIERRTAEVEAQLRRRQKLRTQERSRHQVEQLEKLKRQLAELEANLEKEAENDEASLLAEFERRKAEAQTRAELQRRERERQRQEEEKTRREREEAFARRKHEIEQRHKDLEEALWRKEEERLQADQSRLEKLQTMIDTPDSVPIRSTSATSSPAELELQRRTEEVRQREERLRAYEQRLEEMAQKLQKLPDVDSLLRVLETIKFDPSQSGQLLSQGSVARKTAETYKAEITELHKLIMEGADVHGEQAIMDANIKLEKLMQEYEKTPEYKAEVERAVQERRAKNEQPNKEALQRIKLKYTAANVQADADLVARIAAHPELRILFMEPATILRVHEKDFAAFTLRGLELDELRALAALMPKNFAPAQKLQQAWLQGLHDKIDALSANPDSAKPKTQKRQHAPPRPALPKQMRTPPVPAGGNIFEEIKRRGGKVVASPKMITMPEALAIRRPAVPKPNAALSLPPLPPAGAATPPPPTASTATTASSRSTTSALQQVQGSLERLVKLLAQASGAHAEKDIASETRTLVTAAKQLADLVPARQAALQECASEMVVAVRSVLVARRGGGSDAAAAKSQLVQRIEALRRAMREL